MKTVFVIVPVFNEESNIPELLKNWLYLQKILLEYSLHFLPVDDGSTDETVTAIRKHDPSLKVTILSNRTNQGPGYAFGTGFCYIKSLMKNDDIVVTMEGDNTSDPNILVIMIGRIVREGVDVALASPLAYGGAVQTNFYRALLGHMASALTKVILNIRGIHTFTCFFRAYKAETIKKLQLRYGDRILEKTGFECMVELLKKLTIIHASITEVPMRLDGNLRVGKSKMKILKTAMGYFRIFLTAKKYSTFR